MTTHLSHSHRSALRVPTPAGPMVLDEYGDPVAPLAVVLAQAWDDGLTPAQTLALVADPDHEWGTAPT